MNIFESKQDDWGANGSFKILHKINHLRLKYVYSRWAKHKNTEIQKAEILDIGCGGGLITEALIKKGCKCTAIDEFTNNPNYIKTKLEDWKDERKFDLIIAFEVIEHTDPGAFIKQISPKLKPGGIVMFSTINRNMKSLFAAIGLAEYVLRWNPIGTHEWKAFVKPDELTWLCANENLEKKDSIGIKLSIFEGWKFCESLDVNYFATFQKT